MPGRILPDERDEGDVVGSDPELGPQPRIPDRGIGVRLKRVEIAVPLQERGKPPRRGVILQRQLADRLEGGPPRSRIFSTSILTSPTCSADDSSPSARIHASPLLVTGLRPANLASSAGPPVNAVMCVPSPPLRCGVEDSGPPISATAIRMWSADDKPS